MNRELMIKGVGQKADTFIIRLEIYQRFWIVAMRLAFASRKKMIFFFINTVMIILMQCIKYIMQNFFANKSIIFRR